MPPRINHGLDLDADLVSVCLRLPLPCAATMVPRSLSHLRTTLLVARAPLASWHLARAVTPTCRGWVQPALSDTVWSAWDCITHTNLMRPASLQPSGNEGAEQRLHHTCIACLHMQLTMHALFNHAPCT